MSNKQKTTFTEFDVLAMIQESPRKHFSRKMIASEFDCTHVTAGKWLQSLADSGLIDSYIEFGVWKYFAIVEQGEPEDDAPIVRPRSNTSSPLNRQNFGMVYDRIRRDAPLITLGTAFEVSPYWAA